MTNTTDKPVTFDDVKAAYLKSFDQIAVKYGFTRQELAQQMVSNLIAAFMFGRAARKGNIAKTIFWGVGALNRGAYMRDRKADAQRKDDQERADRILKDFS